MPSKAMERKIEAIKVKEEGRRESFLFFFLLSVHARTSQANILHLDQKAAKCGRF